MNEHRHNPVAGEYRHRVPTAVKAISALAMVVILVTCTPSLRLYAGAAFALVVCALLSRLPIIPILKRLLLVEPFVLCVAVLSLLQPNGLHIFGLLVARTTLCVFTLVLLSSAASPAELIDLLRRLRVPSLMVTTLALMHRYLYVLQEESRRMRFARQSRTFTPGRRRIWRNLATVVAQLFIRAQSRSERIYAAMCARGWQ